MTLLAAHPWRLKYTPEDGNLVKLFYVPALEDAVRYDRLTGYFNSGALTLAARGIEGLIRSNGHMRLIVGCTLRPPEIEAIEKGQKLRDMVEQHLAALPLAPPNQSEHNALELLAWMIARGILDVRVAVPCDDRRRPIPADGIFHEKAGIIEDKCGDKIAWNGSLNETGAGWKDNWESINVYTDWNDPKRVQQEEANFARIWADRCSFIITLDVPSALKQDLMRFLPDDDRPARLKEKEKPEGMTVITDVVQPHEAPAPGIELRRDVWRFIKIAPTLSNGGERVGEATCSVTPWPHQVRAFSRLYDHWPPKLLIADEVGLGKTIQAGMVLRQGWLAGRAKRILVLAPKAVLKQWQIELREKFNLNWPIFDGQRLQWYPSPGMLGRDIELADRETWHQQNVVIASSHLLRRTDRLAECLGAERWDLVVLDEAHHARRRSAGAAKEGGPNALLRLMQGLKERTKGIVLLTATPMQVHPIEVWDLLSLLGLPPEWTANAFLSFFDDLVMSNPSPEAFERMATLFQATERAYGSVVVDEAIRITGLSRLKTGKVLKALRDSASIPRRQLEVVERTAAIKLLRSTSPTKHLISRHTRELLRRYYKAGRISTPIADRQVHDEFIDLTAAERLLYEAVEDYIASTYNNAAAEQRNAVGFVMTIYRRRLASSFRALAKTLRGHLDALGDGPGMKLPEPSEEDVADDDGPDGDIDLDDAAKLEHAALVFEEKGDIQRLLGRILQLPPDTKLGKLKEVIASLQTAGYQQVMVFTQYTDTMDFLRNELRKVRDLTLMCFSGRGGEVPTNDGGWRVISRDDAKRRFREKQADILLCTDAAAEGLNFQFCGALVNYDMPWNPMRVEQRIGRIDRLGQKYPIIKIINLHYEGTVETDVYRVLRTRINLFTAVVGKLQPILARLPQTIASRVLEGRRDPSVASEVEQSIEEAEQGGFDIDAVTEAELEEPYRSDAALDMHDLDRVIRHETVLPPGITASVMAVSQYAYSSPGMAEPLRVTTDPEFYEEHAESVELWSPGSPLFPEPGYELTVADGRKLRPICELLP